jgi:transcriptional regulator with XRE-family HTH domain
MTVNQVMRSARKSQGLSHARIGDVISGHSMSNPASTVASWESGRRSIPSAYLPGLAKLLGVPAAKLRDGERS